MKSILFAYLFSLISLITYGQKSEIVINISGLRSDKGKCLLYLYNNKKGFPNDAGKAINKANGSILSGKSTIILTDIPDGEYAIGIIHDENDNGRMDTNFLGMPKEGVGVSNNAKGHFGSPSYDDSKFKLNQKSLKLNITIKYL
ncbi:MAG: DUF2141 domain-containing protein [Bacteroidetes bacterium]|nr:DUF2141 domain-containing protein [Bacteroidota bacterium]